MKIDKTKLLKLIRSRKILSATEKTVNDIITLTIKLGSCQEMNKQTRDDILLAELKLLRGDTNARFDKFEADTNARFDKLEADTNARFDKLEQDVNARFEQLENNTNARFDRIETRLLKIEDRLDKIERVLTKHDQAMIAHHWFDKPNI